MKPVHLALVAPLLMGPVVAGSLPTFPAPSRIESEMRQQQFPADAVVSGTQAQLRPQIDRDIRQQSLSPQAIGDLQAKAAVPDLTISMPPPEQTRSALDINQWIDQYEKGQKAEIRKSDAMVFVSAGMPREIVKELMEQARDLGLPVLFRGAVGDNPLSLNQLRTYVLGLDLKTFPEIQINPVAFKQFGITEVPALVVTTPAGQVPVTDSGCAAPGEFAVTYGDTPLRYALEQVQAHAEPGLAAVAAVYLHGR